MQLTTQKQQESGRRGSNLPCMLRGGGLARKVAHWAALCLVLGLSLLTVPGSCSAPFGQQGALRHPLLEPLGDVQAPHAASACSLPSYDVLYSRIEQDLGPWRQAGITSELMDQVISSNAVSHRSNPKAVVVLFEAGVPYLISNVTGLFKTGHHAYLLLAHLLLFRRLGELFGALIPDVEFAVSTFDVPSQLKARLGEKRKARPTQPLPVLRFCTSDEHHDILVPDVHFQLRAFNRSLLSRVGSLSALHPWPSKLEVVFGRFSPYKRIVYRNTSMAIRGTGQQEICRIADHQLLFCEVREHFMEWAAAQQKQGVAIDVAKQPKVEMLAHAKYKYLLHLDGQTCSSRLEQLMVMGSLIFKEDSGYEAFFHHLLRPYEHYVPFWKEGPEDLLDALEWAKTHDDDSRVMARNAQQLAAQYLNPQALTCYWFTVLARLSSLLTFKPGRQHRRYQQLVPVSEFLSQTGALGGMIQESISKHGLLDLEMPKAEDFL